MPENPQGATTEHQQAWWGSQACMSCNPLRLNTERPQGFLPECSSCDGSGWTVWASLASEPWSEIVHNLWIGGHDYLPVGSQKLVSQKPHNEMFDTVISMYSRPGFEPGGGVEHHEFLIPDSSQLGKQELGSVGVAARLAADRVREGKSVLCRCQAGLNRSSLVAGMARVFLGYAGSDAVQLIRQKRSPWALCNPHFVDILEELSAQEHTIPAK